MIRTFKGKRPEIHEEAYVDETAVIIGDVTIEKNASIWPNCTLRGDSGKIVIREGTNIQDNSVCHEDVTIGPYSTVGHNAIVHAATVKERALIGMGSTVLDNSVIGEKALVGANSLVTEGTEIAPSTLVAGIPAKKIKDVEDSPWTKTADNYAKKAQNHAHHSKKIK